MGTSSNLSQITNHESTPAATRYYTFFYFLPLDNIFFNLDFFSIALLHFFLLFYYSLLILFSIIEKIVFFVLNVCLACVTFAFVRCPLFVVYRMSLVVGRWSFVVCRQTNECITHSP